MKLSSIACFTVIASSSSSIVVNAKLRSRKNVQRNTQAKAPIQSRIVGGTEAEQGEFPYFVLWDGCGASLIHEDIIISAAHCNGISTNSVLVGAFKDKSTQGGAVLRSITSRRPHPRYNADTINFDFLVMKLNRPVTTFAPVALNPSSSIPGIDEDLTVIGFGVTSEDSFNQPNTLRKVNVTYVDPITCSNDYNETINARLKLCAGSAGKDSCQGDSGGPIVDSNGVQVGITSYGYGCGQPGFPGIYSRISGAIGWINQQICDLSANPPASCSGGGNLTQPASSPSPTPTPNGVTTIFPTASLSPIAPGETPTPTSTNVPFGFNNFTNSPAPTVGGTMRVVPNSLSPSASPSNTTISSNTTFPYNATLPCNSTFSLNATLSPNATSSPTPSFGGNSTFAPTATPSPGSLATNLPTLAPRNTYSPTVSFGPTPSISGGSNTFGPTSFIRSTSGPTASSAPASATFSPTATASPLFSSGGTPSSPTPAPFIQSGGGSFSLANLRVACETFPCPYNHANVQYCHTESNGRQKAYCVSSDVAFVFLADNERDYCGPCIGA